MFEMNETGFSTQCFFCMTIGKPPIPRSYPRPAGRRCHTPDRRKRRRPQSPSGPFQTWRPAAAASCSHLPTAGSPLARSMRQDDPSCSRGLGNKFIKLELGTVAQSAQRKTNDQSFCGPSLSKRLVDAELSKLPIWESGDRGASS